MRFSISLILCIITASLSAQTIVEIRGERFYINGEPTYKGRVWNGSPIEGLLLNARMVQGIFDDLNPETRDLWKYPDTGTWDPDRNTNEFVAAMPEWREHGLLGFTLNLQGGSPTGYGNKGWKNSSFDAKGSLRPAYFDRLARILNQADRLGMVVMFNEDDHFDFQKPENNFSAALKSFASWGYFDYRLKGETDIREGYQSVPVDWRIGSDRKKGFFQLLRQVTRGN